MRYNIVNFLVLYLAFYISAAPADVVIPFEQCSEKRQTWSDGIAEEAGQFNLHQSSHSTEASAPCTDCAKDTAVFPDSRSAVENIDGIISSFGSNSIPPICFYAASLIAVDEPKYRLYGCKDKNSEWPERKYRMRPCLNEKYTNMTAQAFDEVANCFSFSLEEKKAIFALFNHESHFILNARSPKKARCYGQMTMKTIKYVNQNIYYRNHGYQYGDVYRDAVSNCPGLRDKVIPPSLVTETRFNNTRLRRKMKRASITCGLTQDPYACLFYSMFNVKINLKEFNDNYNEMPDYIGSEKEIPGKMEEDFQLPVMLNEVLVVKGPVKNKSTGKIENIDRVFWDSSQIPDEFEGKEYDVSQLEIKKVPVFKKATLKNVFLHYAHSGGRSIVATHLKVFLEGVKKRVAGIRNSEDEISCSEDQKCSQYRSSLKQGQPLSISDLQNTFVAYARRNRLTNVNELVNFAQKVDQGLKFLQNEQDEIRIHLGRINNLFTDEDDFIHQVKNSCPDSVY